MSSDIEKKIVEIEFENRNFEKGIKQSQKSIQELNKSLEFKDSEKSIKNIEKALNGMQLDDLSNSVKTISERFSNLGVIGVTALTRITNAAITTGKNLIKSFTVDPLISGLREYETQMNSVQTILANTQSKGTTLDQVNAALDELNHYADKTIYNFTQMTQNIGKFTAAGVDLKTSVSAIQGISNLAAVSGSNAQQASTAMYQLSQALAAGRVSLMDWNSVVNAGMGGEVFQQALRKTSEALGTGAEAAIAAQGSFRESLHTGWLTADVLTETLKKFTTSGANEWVAEYTGLTKEAVSETLKAAEAQYGEAEAIEEASKQLAEKSGKNQQEIKDVLEMAKTAEDAATKVKTFSQLMDTLKEAIQSGWSETWRAVVGDFEEAKEMFTSIKDAIEPVLLRSAELRNNMLKTWKALGGRTKLLEGLANIGRSILDVWSAISQAFYDVFGIVGKELYEITAGFAKFTKELVVTKETAEDIKRVVRAVASVLSVVTQIISAVVKMVIQVAVYLKPLISRVLHFVAILGDGITVLNYILKQTRILDRIGKSIARTILLIIQIVNALASIAASAGLIVFRAIFLVIQAIVSLKNAIAYQFGGMSGLVAKVIGIFVKRFPEIGKLLNDLTPLFGDFGKNIGIFVGSIKKAFGGLLDAVDAFTKAFSIGIMAFFDEFSSLESFSLEGLKRAFSSFWKSFTKSLEDAGVDLEAIQDAFKTFGAIISTIFTTVFSIIEPIIKTAINLISVLFGLITDKSVLAVAALFIVVMSIIKLVNGITSLHSEFVNLTKSITAGIKDISNSVSSYLKAKAMEERSKALVNLGKSIALMAGSLILLTFVDQEKLKTSTIALGAFAGSIMVLVTGLNILSGFLVKKGIIVETGLSGFASSILALSFSMLIVIKAVSNMQAEMNKVTTEGGTSFIGALWSLIRAFAVLSILATTMALIASKWAPNSSKIAISYTVQLLGVVIALKQLSDPKLNIKKGIVGLWNVGAFLVVFLGVELIASKFSSGSKTWANALASVLALNLLLSTMKKIDKFAPEQLARILAKTLMVIAAYALVMKSVTKVSEHDTSKTIRATALAFLGLVLATKILSKLDAADIMKGTIGVSALLVPLAGIMLITRIGANKIEAAAKTILAMSAAISVMALCAALLSLIDSEALLRGTLAISIMTAIMGGVVALTRFVNKASNGIKTMKMIAVIVGIIAASALVLSFVNINNLIVTFSGITLVLGAIALVFLAVKKLRGLHKSALALTALTVPIIAIAGALVLLEAMNIDASLDTVIGLSALLVALSVCAKLMSNIGVKGIFVGAGGLLAMGVALMGLFGLFGLLFNLIGDGSWFVNGAKMLGECIGALVGGIVGGIAEGLASVLPNVGTYLTQFMENVQGFIDGSESIKGMDFESLSKFTGLLLQLGGMSWLSGALPMLGTGIAYLGAGIERFIEGTAGVETTRLDAVSLMLNGAGSLALGIAGFQSENLASFGEGLPTLAENIITFCDALLGGESSLSVETAEKGAAIFAAFAKVASTVPRTGGMIGLMLGDADLSGFADAMAKTGPAIKEFHNNVVGLEYSSVEQGLKILEETIRVASSVPNSGGFIGLIVGENNLDAFAAMMVSAGPDIKKFTNSIKDVKYKDAKNGLKILKETILSAQSIPNSGDSVAKWFVGDNTLDKFAEQMADAGPNIKKFIDAMPSSEEGKDIYGDATKAVTLLGQLITVASNIDMQSGAEMIWFGADTLSNFATQMADAGPNIKKFIDAMPTSEEGKDIFGDATRSIELLGKLIKVASDIDMQSTAESIWFGDDSLSNFASQMADSAFDIKKFIDAMPTSEEGKDIFGDATKAVELLGKLIGVAASVDNQADWEEFWTGNDSLTAFGEDLADFAPYFQKFWSKMSSVKADGDEMVKKTEAMVMFLDHIAQFSGLGIITLPDLSGLADNLPDIGTAIKSFHDNTKGLKYETVESGLNLLTTIYSVVSQLTNDGTSFGSFTKQMADAGPNIKAFLDSISEISTAINTDTSVEDVENTVDVYSEATKAIELLRKLIEVASGIDMQSGWEEFWSGNDSLTAFGEDLATFAPSFKTFWTEMSGVNLSGDEMSKKSDAMVKFLDHLAQFTNLSDTKLPDLSNITGQDTVFALAEGMYEASNMAGTQYKIDEAISKIVSLIGDSIDTDKVNEYTNSLTDALSDGISDSVMNNASFYVSIGENILSNIGLGFMGIPMDELVNTLSDGLINGVKHSLGIESPSKEFQEIGRYVVEGLVLGLQNGTSELQTATSRMASTLEAQFRDYMGIHSPSSLFAKLGGYIIDGLKNGLSSGGSMKDILGKVLGGVDFGGIFGDYGSDMKDIFSGVFDDIDLSSISIEGMDDGSFVDGLVAKIQDQIDAQDLTAEIEAVFDADAVQSQLNELTTGTLSTTGTGNVASATMDSFVNTKFDDGEETESGGKNTFNFVQNNYSPTELDRIAIYRQTRNQFAAMKEAINKL